MHQKIINNKEIILFLIILAILSILIIIFRLDIIWGIQNIITLFAVLVALGTSILTLLNNKKIDTKQRKTQELIKTEFEESINKINPLLEEIEKTDNEIDQMVYELYGLNDDEIEIVEKSLISN